MWGKVRAVPGSDAPTRRLRVPHTLVLLLAMIVAAWIATWLVPQGEFARTASGHGHQSVVPGSYAPLPEPVRLAPWTIVTAVPRGLVASADIIFFVFIIGGVLGIVRRTGTIDALLGLVLRRFGHRPGWLIAAGMAVFAVGSSTLGMAEEYIPFIPVLLGLCAALGLDAVTAVGICVLGYGVGYGAAAVNPFTVVVAQEIAGLPPTSGAWFRVLLLIPFWLAAFTYLRRYAAKVARDPSASLVADVPEPPDLRPPDPVPMTARHGVVTAMLVAAFALVVWGIKTRGWYLEEMSATFLALGIAVIAAGRLGADEGARTFIAGAAELTLTALLIGFARGIKIVLEDGRIIDTIIDAVAAPLASAGPAVAAVGMFAFQSVLNFFIPSGSGQAYVTMPIMAPLADLTGVGRQVAVLAYQFGDGLTNMMIPTNAVLVGILGMAGIPFERWLRFVMPAMVRLWLICITALLVALWIGYA